MAWRVRVGHDPHFPFVMGRGMVHDLHVRGRQVRNGTSKRNDPHGDRSSRSR